MSTVAARAQRLSDAVTLGADGISAVVARHRESAGWLVGVLAVSGAVSFANLAAAPRWTGAEGSAVARALALLPGSGALFPGGGAMGAAASGAASGSGSPLGVLQLALGLRVAGVARGDLEPLVAARGVTAVATLVSVVLVWAIARRLGASRGAAAVGGLVFVVSPLALTLHRVVSFDDLATPWLLAATLLVLARRAQAVAVPAAALCVAVAVLTRDALVHPVALPGLGSVPVPDAALLAIPVLAGMAAGESPHGTRRVALGAAGVVLVAVGGAVLGAAVLGGSVVGGSAVPASSLAPTLDPVPLDPVLLVAGPLAAIGALLVRTLWPLGAFVLVCSGLAAAGPDGTPWITAVLPYAVLLVVVLVDRAVRRRSEFEGRGRTAVAAAAGVAVVAVVVATWSIPLRTLLADDPTAPVRSAVAWIDRELPARSRILADDAVRLSLASSGRNAVRTVGVDARAGDWRDVDYLVDTASLRSLGAAAVGAPLADRARAHSLIVASWGSGQDAVEVRRVLPLSADGRRALLTELRADAAGSGQQLAVNPRLTLTPSARRMLESGGVDPRIPIALGAETATVELHVADFPAVTGDSLPLRRQVLVDSVGGVDAVDPDGSLTPAARDFVGMLAGPFAPARTEPLRGSLLLTWSADLPAVPDP